MNIVGFIPNSFVDYPKNISAVIFIGGCNFDCSYCHNKWTISAQGEFDLEEILQRIASNAFFLDAVTITGGEPTLQKTQELEDLIKKIKALGLKVKLDTNGTKPQKLAKLLPLIDYVAMDVKAPLDKYHLVTPISHKSLENIKESIELIKNAALDYEFRTTFAPELDLTDIETIAKTISGSKQYFIQKYNPIEGREDSRPHSKDYTEKALKVAEQFVPTFLRGY